MGTIASKSASISYLDPYSPCCVISVSNREPQNKQVITKKVITFFEFHRVNPSVVFKSLALPLFRHTLWVQPLNSHYSALLPYTLGPI